MKNETRGVLRRIRKLKLDESRAFDRHLKGQMAQSSCAVCSGHQHAVIAYDAAIGAVLAEAAYQLKRRRAPR